MRTLKLNRALSRFGADEDGQAVTEYILVIGLIVAPIALAFNKFQNVVRNLLSSIMKLLYGPGI